MDTLALTDRDGTYGAVKFVGAARRAGIRPVLGVDLAVARTTDAATGGAVVAAGGRPPPRRTPARGGVSRDPSQQQGGSARVTFLAMGRAGWAALCRMVSSVHLSGERGRPVATLDLLAPHLAGGDVLVLLGPSSELGAVATRRRDDLGPAVLAPWLEVVPRPNLVVELVSHRLGGRGGALGAGHVGPRRADGRPRPARRPHDGADQRGALHRPARRADGRRARRGPATGAAGLGRTARRRPRRHARQRRGIPQDRQADARGGRARSAASPGWATASGRRGGCSPARGRSRTGARSTRAPTSASARCTSRSSSSPMWAHTARPTPCCAPAARRRSAGATAPAR